MQAALQPTDRVALVTGGARRIGAAIVRGLTQSGYAVAIHAHRSGAQADALRAEIEAAGGRRLLADLADHAAVTPLIGAAVAVGPLTLLVNNAGEFEPDAVGSLDRALFDRQFAVNLRAPLFLARDIRRAGSGRRRCVDCQFVDQRVYKLTPRFVSYTLTKSALHTATMTLAQALAPHVRVNARCAGADASVAAAGRRQICRGRPQPCRLARGPTPEEIAEAVLYLAGASSVTGVTIAVDGGQHIAWQTPGRHGHDE